MAVKPAGNDALLVLPLVVVWSGASKSKRDEPAAGSMVATNLSCGREAGAFPAVRKLGGGAGAKLKISFGATPDRSMESSTSSSTRFAKPTGAELALGRSVAVDAAGSGVLLPPQPVRNRLRSNAEQRVLQHL